jgi:hypothetical protein
MVPLERMGLHPEESCYADQAQRDHQYNCMSRLHALTQLKIFKKSKPSQKEKYTFLLLIRR